MREIPLTRGYVALVDDEDYERLSLFKWSAMPSGKNLVYACRTVKANGKGHTIRMHKEILPVPKGFVVDHINDNGLDNRRCNLRPATIAQNIANGRHRARDGFRGVTRCRLAHRPYQATIGYQNRTIHLGTFPDPISAARAYDDAARRYFGEFARLNFQNDSTPPSTDVVPDVHVALGAGA